jgi:hypothetical protein
MMKRSPSDEGRSGPALEAAATGLGYGAVLCFASACLVASFRPQNLPSPYWPGVLALRTDTAGAVAFIVAAFCLTVSKYLRMRRLQQSGSTAASAFFNGPARLLALALAEMTTVLSTGLVIYLSLNAVTHPGTLKLQATHFLSWPTEGTLRMVALILCVISTAVVRYLRAYMPMTTVDGSRSASGLAPEPTSGRSSLATDPHPRG